MAGWSAIEDVAGAMRRLNRAVAGRHASDAELAAVAEAAHALAERLEAGPARDKEADMAALALWPMDGGPRPVAVGEQLEFDPFSVAGGKLSPSSIGFDIVRDGETSVLARVVVDPMFQGPPGRVHGGVVTLLVDEVMSSVNRVLGRRAFTARLTVNLRAAAPIGVPLELRAWLDDVSGRKVSIRLEGRSDEGVFVEADGLFVVPRPPA